MQERPALRRTIGGWPCWTLAVTACLVAGCSTGINNTGSTTPVQTATPSFYPEAGTYTSPQKVAITDASSGAAIYYTTDGSAPTTSSMVYSGPIQVATTTAINAMAVTSDGSRSPCASGTFVLDLPIAPAPKFSIGSGTYTTAQTVSLSSDIPGAEIHFTLDGSSPTVSSTLYATAIQVKSSSTIRALTTAYGFQPSPEGDALYSIEKLPAAAPSFAPSGGTYTTSQNVVITTTTPNAAIHYTTDGSTPTSASTLFSRSVSVSSNGSTTIRAIATAPDFAPSDASSATYLLNLPMAPPPTTFPVAGGYTTTQSVVLADGAAGSSIFYTVDGSLPTTSSARYSMPISVSTSTNIRAIATAPNYTPSVDSSNRFTFPAPGPAISPAGGAYAMGQTVTLTDLMPGANIFYTLDGSSPSAASMPYTRPIQISRSATVKAVASVPNFTLSPETAATYTIYTMAPSVTISPNGGSYNSPQAVTLSDVLAGAVIYYTLDGSLPDTSSTLYTDPLLISAAGSTTINTFATYTGLTSSAVSSATFTLILPITGPPSYTYKNVQIGGGGFIDGIYFHPAQQGLMYAHTDIGGAYRWNAVSGGDAQWVPLNDSIGRFNSGFDLSVQSLALDPGDASRLYLAVGAYTESYGVNGAVLASSDMGKTFTSTALPFKNGGNDSGRNDGDRLVVDPNNGRHLYLGTFFNGLYETLDRAVTWMQVRAFPITGSTSNPEDPEAGIVFEQFVASSGTATNGNTKTVYYGVSSPTKGVYVSQDGGSTFAARAGSTHRILSQRRSIRCGQQQPLCDLCSKSGLFATVRQWRSYQSQRG